MSASTELTGLIELFGAQGLPEGTLPLDVQLVFELHGPGGGTWTLTTPEGRTVLSPGGHARFDCRLRCLVSDLEDLLRGHLAPREGFLEGRLEVEGDVGLVLRLHRVLAGRPSGTLAREAP
jgi:hypothetical protein